MLMFLAMCSAISPKELINLCGPIHPSTLRYALIKYGGGIVQMSGSIAGNTFARNRYGNYMRARTKPVNPDSSRQVKVRAIIATLVERWNETLTAAQRTAWGTYADAIVMKNKLGESIHLSGFNHFIRSNCSYVDLGGGYFDDGPTVLGLAQQDPTFAIAASAATQLISVTFDTGLDWVGESGAGMFLLDGRPQLVTRNFFAGPYRGLEWIGGSLPTPPTSPQDHTGIFTLVEGQKIWVQARIVRYDGRLSEPFGANCIIAA